MKQINDYIDSMNFFTYKPKLLISRDSSLKTHISRIFTMIYLLIIGILSIALLTELFNYKNSFVISSEERNSIPYKNFTEIPLFFQIYNSPVGLTSIKEPNEFFEIKVYSIKQTIEKKDNTTSSITNIENLPFGKCTDYYDFVEYLNPGTNQIENKIFIKTKTIRNLNKNEMINKNNLTDNKRQFNNIDPNINNLLNKIKFNEIINNENKNDEINELINQSKLFNNKSNGIGINDKYIRREKKNSKILQANSISEETYKEVIFPNNIYSNDLLDKYCLDPLHINELYGMLYDFKNQSFLQIQVSKRKNVILNQDNNKSKKFQNESLTSIFSFNFLDYFIDNRNLTTPGQNYIHNEIFILSSNINRQIDYYMTNIDYETDFGLIGSNSCNSNFHKFSEPRILTDYFIDSNPVYMTINIRMNSLKLKYFRKFEKFQNVLAIVTALSFVLISVLNLISRVFTEIAFYQKLINNLGLFKKINIDVDANEGFRNNIFAKKINIMKKSGFDSNSPLNYNKNLNNNLKNISNNNDNKGSSNKFKLKRNAFTPTNHLNPVHNSNNFKYYMKSFENNVNSANYQNKLSLNIEDNNLISINNSKVDLLSNLSSKKKIIKNEKRVIDNGNNYNNMNKKDQNPKKLGVQNCLPNSNSTQIINSKIICISDLSQDNKKNGNDQSESQKLAEIEIQDFKNGKTQKALLKEISKNRRKSSVPSDYKNIFNNLNLEDSRDQSLKYKENVKKLDVEKMILELDYEENLTNKVTVISKENKAHNNKFLSVEDKDLSNGTIDFNKHFYNKKYNNTYNQKDLENFDLFKNKIISDKNNISNIVVNSELKDDITNNNVEVKNNQQGKSTFFETFNNLKTNNLKLKNYNPTNKDNVKGKEIKNDSKIEDHSLKLKNVDIIKKDNDMNKNEKLMIFNIHKILCKKLFNKNSIESRGYLKIENYLKKKISLEEIIKKLFEVDKLKFTLFDEDLLNMFSCIPNPNFNKKENLLDLKNDNFTNLNINNNLIKIENIDLRRTSNHNFANNISNANRSNINQNLADTEKASNRQLFKDNSSNKNSELSPFNKIVNNLSSNFNFNQNKSLRKTILDKNFDEKKKSKGEIQSDADSLSINDELSNTYGILIYDLWNQYEFFKPSRHNIKKSIYNVVESGDYINNEKSINILNLLKV